MRLDSNETGIRRLNMITTINTLVCVCASKRTQNNKRNWRDNDGIMHTEKREYGIETHQRQQQQ